jgi:AcrR family transcriptional regulator
MPLTIIQNFRRTVKIFAEHVPKAYTLHVARPALSARGVTQAAMTIVDRNGFDALNLSSVAADLGVGPSALYTHVDGLAGLKYLVAVQSTTNLANQVRDAAVGIAGEHALEAVGTAYRNFAHTRAGQFASTFLPPLSDDDDLAAANRSLLDVFVLVYRAMGLTPDESHLAARSTRSAIHGFCALELASGTSTEHDDEYRHLLRTLHRGLRPDLPDRPLPASQGA